MASNIPLHYRQGLPARMLATVLVAALCSGAEPHRGVAATAGATADGSPAAAAGSPAAQAGAHPVAPAREPTLPRSDGHVHLLSPAGAALLRMRLGADVPLDAYARGASMVVAMLDSAGTRRALVISGAYELVAARLGRDAEEAAVRTENDWVAAQVARAPGRLTGFCSVDPLRGYALRELTRCRSVLRLRGVKLHFSAAGVDLRNPSHVRRLRTVFSEADRLGLALLVHIRTMRPDYGATDAHLFLDRVLPAAPHVPVQVAHLAGWGGYDAGTDAALAVFAAAARAGALRNGVYFDLAFVAAPAAAPRPDVTGSTASGAYPGDDALVLARLRQLGPGRVVFGSDWPLGSCASYAADLRAGLPDDTGLVAAILRNVPPYLR